MQDKNGTEAFICAAQVIILKSHSGLNINNLRKSLYICGRKTFTGQSKYALIILYLEGSPWWFWKLDTYSPKWTISVQLVHSALQDATLLRTYLHTAIASPFSNSANSLLPVRPAKVQLYNHVISPIEHWKSSLDFFREALQPTVST